MSVDKLKSASTRVRWCRIDPDRPAGLHAPKRDGDVGWDLEAMEDTSIRPGEAVDVPINARLQLPEGIWAEIRARSSVARRGLQVDAGTIDPGYRGPLFALVRNMAFPTPDAFALALGGIGYREWYHKSTVMIAAGERVAQVVYHRVAKTWAVEVDEIDETSERGNHGFGSTGS